MIDAEEDATICPTLRAQMHGNIPAVVADGRSVVGCLKARYAKGCEQLNETLTGCVLDLIRCIARRLTPTECARLQGFPDWWAELPHIADMTDEDYSFWCDALRAKATIEDKLYKPKTKPQMVAWYNKLHTDGAEYKMWGNGVALPVVRVPLHGMAKLGAKTLGSLFDGSGGFPLVGVLEGITPLWCSEIEPYPIAVTRERFKEVAPCNT